MRWFTKIDILKAIPLFLLYHLALPIACIYKHKWLGYSPIAFCKYMLYEKYEHLDWVLREL